MGLSFLIPYLFPPYFQPKVLLLKLNYKSLHSFSHPSSLKYIHSAARSRTTTLLRLRPAYLFSGLDGQLVHPFLLIHRNLLIYDYLQFLLLVASSTLLSVPCFLLVFTPVFTFVPLCLTLAARM